MPGATPLNKCGSLLKPRISTLSRFACKPLLFPLVIVYTMIACCGTGLHGLGGCQHDFIETHCESQHACCAHGSHSQRDLSPEDSESRSRTGAVLSAGGCLVCDMLAMSQLSPEPAGVLGADRLFEAVAEQADGRSADALIHQPARGPPASSNDRSA
jgi:hypothetical protein